MNQTVVDMPEILKPINVNSLFDNEETLFEQINSEMSKSPEKIHWESIQTKLLLIAHLLKLKRNKGEDVSDAILRVMRIVELNPSLNVGLNTKSKLIKVLAIKKP